MSYCRFGEGDVYVYLSVDHHLECCGCILQDREFVEDENSPVGFYLKSIGKIIETNFYKTADMIKHLEIHKESGHYVPDFCIEDLLRDQEENDKIMMENKL